MVSIADSDNILPPPSLLLLPQNRLVRQSYVASGKRSACTDPCCLGIDWFANLVLPRDIDWFANQHVLPWGK
jgi:hypothetical protein